MERIKLNLIPSGVAPVVHLSQYDEGREFGIDLFEGESVYVLDGTETLTVNVRKPDGHIVTEGVTNTGTSSLTVTTTEQMTAVKGTNLANLKIEKGSVTIATLNFLMAVEVDPLENGDPSESFIHNLETQIAQAVSEQYDSANVVFDPAPTTGHGTGFAVTSEGVKTAIDNAIGGLSIPEDLNDLSDVDTTTPTQGEALVWDGTKWVNGTVSTVGNLDDLSDVDTTGKQEGDSLRYIGGEWKAKPTTVEMTQAEYDAIVDFTPYANTHIVITDAPNLNPTASDIEYSSGVTVKQAIDGIVESGSNANGNYIKYADGTMICTKTTEFSIDTSEWQAWGTCYETALKDCGVWAMNFISNPVVSATQTGGAGWLEYFFDTDNTNVGKTRFVRPTVPGATAIYKMNVIGIGRWKA